MLNGRSHARDSIQGFTLIELLVVIAIVAVLMAVLLPCLRGARSMTRRAVCGSQLKQIAMAWQLYLDDHQGRFYQANNANHNYGGWLGLAGLQPRTPDGRLLPRPLNRYIQVPGEANESEAHVFLCPSDQGGVPGSLLREKAYQCNGTSFQTNLFLVGQNRVGAFSPATAALDAQISERLPDMNVKQAANPSRLILIGDFGWVNQWRGAALPQAWKELAEWHGRPDFYNVAFLDIHVRFLRIRKLAYVSDDYTVLPFKDLYPLAHEVQSFD